MRRVLSIFLLFAAAALSLQAIPARKSQALYRQPDGSTFEVRIRGDEWSRFVTTADGCAIATDEAGWWCYAVFSPDGSKKPSAYRVGSAVPAGVLARSRAIPYDAKRAHAALRRSQLREAVTRSRLPESRGGDGALIERSVSRAPETPQEHRILVILAQTQDVRFTATREMFVNMLTQQNYSYNGGTGSVKDYFDFQLDGRYDISIDVSSIVTVSENMYYYAKNDFKDDDTAPEKLVAEACQLAHDDPANPIDFSRYDVDGDGYVDNIFVFVPGADEADGAPADSTIWSHSWSLKAGGINLTLDGKILDAYAISTELMDSGRSWKYSGTFTGIGTFCHEYSHILGLQDYYDTDYEGSGGQSEALWAVTALMDGGNSNNKSNTPPNYNAIDLYELEIGTCETATFGTYTLQPISREKRYLKLETDYPGEFYLIECRDNSGWDAYIKGKGLAIYHIDQSGRPSGHSTGQNRELTAYSRWYDFNEINCRPDRQCADMIEANPGSTSARTVFFPYGKTRAFGAYTTPTMTWWSGAKPELGLTDITLNADGSVTFKIAGEMFIEGVTAYQDAIVISWSGSDRECSVLLGDETRLTGITSYDGEKYAAVIEGLSPNTEYSVTVTDGRYTSTRTIKTKSYYPGSNPFIYLVDAERDESGRFVRGTSIPLRVYNAPDAQRIEWLFRGSPVTVAEDCRFTIKASGILVAKIHYADGSVDIIEKEILLQ